ncbi:MAG: Thiosulfate sulfurtransferase GlpE [Chloroflexota bacterium]|nr:MAG: Thiosulfate sulfurtransferase GlpE [Chloroflexota bacterium]|tara:strand:+ start:17973 stop:18917 length:945 start_codon:yes stop_codon:yes gene_type:complete
MNEDKFKIIAFYEFKTIESPREMRGLIKSFCSTSKIRGTVIIATEGINGTICGLNHDIDSFLEFTSEHGFSNNNIKTSHSKIMPFYRLKVKVKKEIITFYGEPIDPTITRGESLTPKDWEKIIQSDDVVVLDVRNKYETRIGSFKNSIDPETNSFTEFKQFIDSKISDYHGKKIAMYCTGGIRCEKASMYVKSLGHQEVYQLHGGILNYLEATEPTSTSWDGECFVFDNRVSVTHELNPGSYQLCSGCREPISSADKQSRYYEEGVSCPSCFHDLTENKIKGSRDRSRQIKQNNLKGRISTFTEFNTDDYRNLI